jgi:hypothetical protein
MITYLKLGGIAALAAFLLWTGYHFGGLSADGKLANYKTAVEAQHAAQLQAVANVMAEHDRDAAAQRASQQKVIDAYDTQILQPLPTAGIVERVRLVEAASCSSSNRVVPSAGALAGGAQAAGGVPRSNAEGDRLLQAALDAADRDSARLNVAVKLAP